MNKTASGKSVTVVGMGYVGLTLSAVLVSRGYEVWGIDNNESVVACLRKGRAHIFEPGVADILKKYGGKAWHCSTRPSQRTRVAILCVSTPVTAQGNPNLSHLRAAARLLSLSMPPGCLVLVRSTVPIGTTRSVVLPELARSGHPFYLGYCPERTIQGQALREIVGLPQVVGSLDGASSERAEQFFSELGVNVVQVSSLEAAEMVKLANNCHTDLIYSYGNEIANIAGRYNLDPLEVISAANYNYPRPDLSKPGFVGGPCLTKDPFLFAESALSAGYEPQLILQSRALNQKMPLLFLDQLFKMMKTQGIALNKARVFVCGVAYKGVPITDDLRGSPAVPFILKLRSKRIEVRAHDYLVKPSAIRSLGAHPMSLPRGFRGADAVVFLTNHPHYQKLDLSPLIAVAKRPLVYLDAWRMHHGRPELIQPGIVYGGLGYIRR